MPCYGCGSSFGAFKKEHGCKNCGFSFCVKCLPHKVSIPKLNNEKHRVCLKCFNIMTGKVQLKNDTGRYSPPENYKKRVAALEERERGSGARNLPTHSSSQSAHGNKYAGMAKEDRALQERLDKLKEKTPAEKAAGQVTEKELEERLARVKGLDPAKYSSSKPAYIPPKRQTQQEEINDLLDEISNEVELDSRLPDPVQELSDRLSRLREADRTKHSDKEPNNLNKTSLRDSQAFSQNIASQPSTPGHITEDKDGSTTTKEPNQPNTKPAVNRQASENLDNVSAEDVGRILNEAAQELEQDAQKALKGLAEDKEIMKRLQEVKQRRKQSSTDVNKDEAFEDSGTENDEDDDDDKLAADIIKRAMEESKLDEAAAKDGIDVSDPPAKQKKKVNNDDDWYDPDELPYCCICTEDATVRCLGCDHDLYCQACFREGHQELGLTDHVTIKYTPPKGVT